MLFQFEIPQEEDPDENLFIVNFIVYGIIRALEFQEGFLETESQSIADQIKKLKVEYNDRLIIEKWVYQ